MEYSNTSKAYHLYDELNKKFILFRDVIFLESSKIDNVVKRQLDIVDRFSHAKTFQGFDHEIRHIEGGIHLLDQSVESPSKLLSSPHEVPTTSLDQEYTLSDVIERIGGLDLDATISQSK